MNRFIRDNKYAALGLTAFSVIVAGALAVFVIFNFGIVLSGIRRLLTILTPIIDGVALAYILTPLLNFVEREWIGRIYARSKKEMTHKRKDIVYLFFRLIIPQLIASIKSIVYQFPRLINNLERFIAELFADNPDIESTINEFITDYSIQLNNIVQTKIIPQAEDLIKTFSLSVIGVIKALLNLIIGVIISLYLMATKELLAGQAKKIMYALYENRDANRLISGIRYTHTVFIGFLSGKLIDSVIIGILCFIIISIVGIPYAVLVSVIVGVTNIIPFFGPYIGAIPSILLVLMINPVKALYLLIIIIVLQQLDGNVIGPKILGDSTGLSSFWVIFSITVFGGMFGIPGMLLGVPSFAVIYALVKYKVNRKLKSKDMPQDTSPYVTVGSVEKDGSFIEYVPVKGRSILQIIGIDKTKAVKRDILSDDSEE